MIPTSFTSGENIEWTKTLADYPAPDWVVTYYLRGPGSLDVEGVGDGSVHTFTVTPEDSEIAPGRYFYQGFAVKGSTDNKLVDEGTLDVKKALSTVTGAFDGRSDNEKALAAIRAALKGTADDGVQSYVVQTPQGHREVRSYSLAELMGLDKYFSALVAAERAATNGESVIGTEYFKFGKP